MRLIKLSANKMGFHTVHFNESGLSIIVGRKKNIDNTNRKKTYNSVGKSLIVYLVHFCLGANKNEELENNFSFHALMDMAKITSERRILFQNCIKLDLILL